MGFFRLFLALVVIRGHVSQFFGLTIMPGNMAVEIFFIISGFYMAMILNEKYIGVGSYKLFITNRALKLYPAYLCVVALVVSISIIYHYFFGITFINLQSYLDYYDRFSLTTSLFIAITNIIIIGQDMIMFMGLDTTTGNLFFTSNFWKTEPGLYSFLMVPQAWSISIEIMFYVIAPFLVRKNLWIILTFFSLSFIIKYLIVYKFGLDNDPWTYRFLPSEIQFFMLGVLSYRFYRLIENIDARSITLMAIISISGLVYGIYAIQFSHYSNEIKELIVFSFATISIPFLFLKTKSSRFDRYLGELSYPVYLSHFLVISSTFEFLKHFGLMSFQFPIVATITIIISVMLNKFISIPMERIRFNRVKTANLMAYESGVNNIQRSTH